MPTFSRLYLGRRWKRNNVVKKVDDLAVKYEIDKYIARFDIKNQIDERAICFLFDLFPYNKEYSQVVAKVAELNALYSAGIPQKDISSVGKHIMSIDNLDELFRKGEMKAVDRIGQTENGINNAYVFASKYCSFHNPTEYLMFDSYGWYAMYRIAKENGLRVQLSKEIRSDYTGYKKYKDCVDEFLKKLEVSYDYKNIDKFLWLYGKELRGKEK